MKERGLIVYQHEVGPIMDGRQTRITRVVKPQPLNVVYHKGQWIQASCEAHPEDVVLRCPFGAPGDRLWVREVYAYHGGMGVEGSQCVEYLASKGPGYALQWRSPVTMPRWASRCTVEVVSVVCQRVKDISAAGCVREGVHVHADGDPCDIADEATDHFIDRWDSIPAHKPCTVKTPAGVLDYANPYCWASNPWVWTARIRVTKGGG